AAGPGRPDDVRPRAVLHGPAGARRPAARLRVRRSGGNGRRSGNRLMQRWTTPEPLVLPIPFEIVRRLDLEFINVRRDAGSFTAFVFLNAGDLPPDAGREHEHFAGSFTIFAPTECWGVDDHCDWRRGPVSVFDRRPPHHLAPINVSMEVTDTIRRLG